MKKLIRVSLLVLTVLALVLCVACTNEPAPTEKETTGKEWTVKFFDADGVTVLKEVKVADGSTVEMPELTREGYQIEGFYATPSLLIKFDTEKKITEDTSVFVAWQSSKVDERPWMIAGSLRYYPENNWGKVWPQDDFRLTKSETEFNTFTIEVNLFKGDEFKIAVIAEGYVWDDTASVDASMLANQGEGAALSGGENAFDSGANIKVNEDGKYRLTLKTDAETLSLCKLSYERIGDADEPQEMTYEMLLWASFNDWQGQEMKRNGEEMIWYCEADVPAGGGEFGVKNNFNGDWYSSEEGTNIQLEEGHYMIFIELKIVDGKSVLAAPIVAETPAYYMVGTCGNQGWAADAIATNDKFRMTEKDGKYVLEVELTEADTADWTEGKVAFKIAYGAGGRVANEFWYGTEEGGNIMIETGKYVITLDPATGVVTCEKQ